MPSQRSLCEFLSRCQSGKAFYNGELILLRSFLAVASVSLYRSEETEAYLGATTKLSDVDFESVYCMFSGVEAIFLTETAGVYLNRDVKTRRLYHERLRLFARNAEGMDELAAAREIASAAANRKSTHIGAVLKPYRGAAPKLYFYFLSVLTISVAALYVILMRRGIFVLGPAPVCDRSDLYVFQGIPAAVFCKDRCEDPAEDRLRAKNWRPAKTLVSVATLLFGEEKDEQRSLIRSRISI